MMADTPWTAPRFGEAPTTTSVTAVPTSTAVDQVRVMYEDAAGGIRPVSLVELSDLLFDVRKPTAQSPTKQTARKPTLFTPTTIAPTSSTTKTARPPTVPAFSTIDSAASTGTLMTPLMSLRAKAAKSGIVTASARKSTTAAVPVGRYSDIDFRPTLLQRTFDSRLVTSLGDRYSKLGFPCLRLDFVDEKDDVGVMPLTRRAYRELEERHNAMVAAVTAGPLVQGDQLMTLHPDRTAKLSTTYLRHPDAIFDVHPEIRIRRPHEAKLPDVVVTNEEFELLEGIARVVFKQTSDLFAILLKTAFIHDFPAALASDTCLLAESGLHVTGEQLKAVAEQLVFLNAIRHRGRDPPCATDSPAKRHALQTKMKSSLFTCPRDVAREAEVEKSHPEYAGYFVYGLELPDE